MSVVYDYPQYNFVFLPHNLWVYITYDHSMIKLDFVPEGETIKWLRFYCFSLNSHLYFLKEVLRLSIAPGCGISLRMTYKNPPAHWREALISIPCWFLWHVFPASSSRSLFTAVPQIQACNTICLGYLTAPIYWVSLPPVSLPLPSILPASYKFAGVTL